MREPHQIAHEDGLALRWLVLKGQYVPISAIKRNAKMSHAKTGNSRETLFECRALLDPSLRACRRQGAPYCGACGLDSPETRL